MTGASKLGAVSPSPENFARWGFSPAFMYAIGALEVLGAIGLVLRPVAPFAAIGLALLMLGAIETGVVHHEPPHIFGPAVLIVLLGVVVYTRARDRNVAAVPSGIDQLSTAACVSTP